MPPLLRDRRTALLDPAQTTLNGIDYVEIANAAQTRLDVHFLKAAPALAGAVTGATIAGGDTIPTVPVRPFGPADWSVDAQGRPVLTLQVDSPGDFSFYTLTLTGGPLDPYFARATFSFKAGCPSDLDCEARPPACPPEEADTPPIDYLAKDFLSFRKALLDFSALRYPEWRERSEADFGMMFLEALSGLADDLSYTQDRIAAEAYLDTATERRSLVRHARLVDYEPRPATAARVLLQFDVNAGPVPAGVAVSAQRPDSTPIEFETGTGLRDRGAYPASPRWNATPGIEPYLWDDDEACLPAGATEMFVDGHGFGFSPGVLLLLDTRVPNPADPPLRQVVQLTAATEELDPLFPTAASPAGRPVTRITWRAEDALTHAHDLTRTLLAGNLVPATQGRRHRETFAIPPGSPGAGLPLAAARIGPNSAPAAPTYQYLYTLFAGRLAWLATETAESAADEESYPEPEIHLVQQSPGTPAPWAWQRLLLRSNSLAEEYTVDPVRFRPVGAAQGGPAIHQDYDGDGGDSIRFGDGVFGRRPDEGAVFQVIYRAGGGAEGNVAPDSITQIDPAFLQAGVVRSVRNPFPAAGGADEEPDERVRRLAPQAFRARQFRAVRAEDYRAAAERLSWVQRAGTVFRYTGSWLTVFTTVDPKGTDLLPVGRHVAAIDLLNRYRIAGYESYVPEPRYVALDLVVRVCARRDAFRGDVKEGVLEALGIGRFPEGTPAFFHPDRFTFGTPLERSALEAAIQDAPGVGGVIEIRYRRRGFTSGFVSLPSVLEVSAQEILRVENDPDHPEQGSVRVYVEGGK